MWKSHASQQVAVFQMIFAILVNTSGMIFSRQSDNLFIDSQLFWGINSFRLFREILFSWNFRHWGALFSEFSKKTRICSVSFTKLCFASLLHLQKQVFYHKLQPHFPVPLTTEKNRDFDIRKWLLRDSNLRLVSPPSHVLRILLCLLPTLQFWWR